jgi:hypothetical protein
MKTRSIFWQGKNIRVDIDMWEIIYSLLQHGYKTRGCCCGHGKYPMSIIYQEGHKFYELFSGAYIPRIRNFYVKDKQGIFYIPESIKVR